MSRSHTNIVQKQSYKVSNTLTVKPSIVVGQRGMIQNRFDSLYDAVLFVHWIRKHTALEESSQVSIKDEGKDPNLQFVVRLKEPTFYALLGDTSVLLDDKNKFFTKTGSATFSNLMELFLPTTSMTEKAKWDAFKAINCLRYISDNLDEIAMKVDDKWNPKHYRFRDDMKKGALRDEQLTAFHIENFKDGKDAKKLLGMTLHEVDVDTLQKLTIPQRIKFAKKLEYDEKVGCLEARNAPAMLYAARVILSPETPTLDDIMEDSEILRDGRKISIVKIALEHCKVSNIEMCAHEGKLQPVTIDLIKAYARDILLEDIDEEIEEVKEAPEEQKEEAKSETSDSSLKSQYLNFCRETNDAIGFSGMVQHRFSHREDATQFVDWLKKQAELQDFGIGKAKVTVNEEKDAFVVRLTPPQFETIMGVGSYDTITLAKNFTSVYKTFNATPQNLEEDAKNRILEIENDIKQKTSWHVQGFFGTKESKEPPTTAKSILKLIEKAKADPKTIWLNVEAEITKALNTTIEKKSSKRTQDTNNFYVTEYAKLTK